MAVLSLPRRPLGQTGMQVSVLGLGTVKFGRNAQVKYPGSFNLPTMEELADLLTRAKAFGINLLDTAPAYGSSETRLGELLAGQRQDWLLCTKAGEQFHDGHSSYDFSPAAIARSLEGSLQRLRTDYLDMVLLHSNGEDAYILQRSGALEVLADWKRQGLIRAFGISHKTLVGAELALSCCDLIMASLSLAYQEETDLIARAGAQGVGVLVKKLFASGHAALTPEAQLASLRLGLTTPGVSSVVLGTINPAHLAANVSQSLALLSAAAAE